MGNLSSSSALDTGKHGAHRRSTSLALVAVAHVMTVTQLQILEIRENCMIGSLGQKRTRPKISRAFFQKAMIRSRISSEEQDWRVLGHLFTMWEDEGEERVDFVEFLTGISVVACGDCKSLQEVLMFAMQVMNVNKTYSITKSKLEKLLNGINATAAYFGDFVFATHQVHVICDSVFESLAEQIHSDGTISHEECASLLARHPMVQQFVRGQGQYKYVAFTHRMEKVDEKGSLIVGVVQDGDGWKTEIGTSSSSDEHNEI